MVSIVIPNYNYARYLPDCIKSCRSQTYKDIEITVVDDCSTDDSLKILDCLGVNFFSLLKNSGCSVARNEGIIRSKGKYIVVLDADDLLLPNSIKYRVDYLESRPDVQMVWGNAYKLNEKRENSEWSYDECLRNIGKLEVYGRYLNAQTLMWRREVFEMYGMYYEELRSKEDKELMYRLGVHPKSPLKKVIKAKKLDAFMAIYRRHSAAKHKLRVLDKKWFEETEDIFYKRIKQLKRDGITKDNTRYP